ncbi:MAG: zinc ABC transporter ATP-binding protein, partial [Tannerellaceae bacterium]|nr:zinc ABC transporter ATP-binding protein [Tannerellaceae bacterium]
MNNKKLITIDHITAGYGDKMVLRDIHLTIYQKDFLGIIGPNG